MEQVVKNLSLGHPSPRSSLACKSLGIEPRELVYLSLDEYDDQIYSKLTPGQWDFSIDSCVLKLVPQSKCAEMRKWLQDTAKEMNYKAHEDERGWLIRLVLKWWGKKAKWHELTLNKDISAILESWLDTVKLWEKWQIDRLAHERSILARTPKLQSHIHSCIDWDIRAWVQGRQDMMSQWAQKVKTISVKRMNEAR